MKTVVGAKFWIVRRRVVQRRVVQRRVWGAGFGVQGLVQVFGQNKNRTKRKKERDEKEEAGEKKKVGDPRMCVKLLVRLYVCHRLGPFWVHVGSILCPFCVHFVSIWGLNVDVHHAVGRGKTPTNSPQPVHHGSS